MTYPSERIRALRKARGFNEWRPIGAPGDRRSKAPANVSYGPVIGRDDKGRVTYATGCRWVEGVHSGLGNIRIACANATKEVSRDAAGYFTDNDCGDATQGAVLQLPSRGGTLLLVPAATDPWNRGMYLADFGNVQREDVPAFDGWERDAFERAMRDAMRAADSLAERYAEDCRDDDARQRAEMDIADARETITDCRLRLRALAAELRTVNLPAAICAELRTGVQRIRAESHAAWQTIRERQANYWSAVGY